MTKKKSNLTPEEKALFRAAVKGSKCFKQDKYLYKKNITQTPSTFSFLSPKSPEKWIGSYEIYLQNLSPAEWVGPEASIYFARAGIQQRTLLKLKKGQLPLEGRLDLHQMTADKAIEACSNFFEFCLSHQMRTVLLVHGKGQFSSEKGPILKNLINRWLPKQSFVLAFSSSKPKDGGNGALYVLLKKGNPNEK